MFSSDSPAIPESLTRRLAGYLQVGTAVAVDPGFLVLLRVPSQAGVLHLLRLGAAPGFDQDGR